MSHCSLGPPVVIATLLALSLLGGEASFGSGGAATQANASVYLTILGEPETFAKEFQPMPPDSRRQIGFSTILYTLRTPVKDLSTQVERVLDKAEKTGYPVLIHLDDWNFPPASSDPELVEWTGWPATGQSHGPLIKRRWVNWGTWLVTEAPRNYESARFRADIRTRLEKGVLPPVLTRLKKWKAEGREYLFAGIVVGWESGFYTAKSLGVSGLDAKLRPSFDGQTFGDEDDVQTGYAALTARGYNAASVKRLAEKRGLTETQVIHELMSEVVCDYATFWARVCCESGIPKDRVYTHFTSVASLSESKLPPQLREDGRVLPLKAATNPYSRPGVTVTDGLCDIDVTSRTFGKLRHPAWGAVEMELTDKTRTEEGAFQMLNHLTDSGAVVMCIYGWWEQKGTPFEARTPGAIKAIHSWLGQ